MTRRAVAVEYRKRYSESKFIELYGPYGMPDLKVARILYAENPILFHSVEDARATVRDVQGKQGNRQNKSGRPYRPERVIAAAGLVRSEDKPRNPYAIPPSDEKAYEPFTISGHHRVAILSDIHVPYHSVEALDIAIRFLKKEKPDLLLLNGDIMDCYQLSKYNRDPKNRDFAGELSVMSELLKLLVRELNCKIIYKEGNHEERYDQFLLRKAKELKGVDEFNLSSLIANRVPAVTVIGDKRIVQIAGLNVIHGHEYVSAFFNPVNAARGLFLRGKTSALQGHTHQTSEHSESDMNGKVTTTWSTGCLCGLHPEYAPLNKWNWGLAIADIDGADFRVRNKRIFKGEIL